LSFLIFSIESFVGRGCFFPSVLREVNIIFLRLLLLLAVSDLAEGN